MTELVTNKYLFLFLILIIENIMKRSIQKNYKILSIHQFSRHISKNSRVIKKSDP